VVFDEFLQRGYDLIPVNPSAGNIMDRHCYSVVEEIDPACEAAFILLPAKGVVRAVERCIKADVKRLWIHRAAGLGVETQQAIASARHAGVSVVAGECPLMWLSGAHWVHRAHKALRQITGHLPN
jgi:predicted CoA-binding protein